MTDKDETRTRMGTKIYSGFKIEVESIDEVQEIVQTFRPIVLDMQKALCRQFMIVETKTLNRDTSSAMHYLCARWKAAKSTGQRDPVDTQFDITLFPAGAFNILGMAFTHHEAWFNEWLKQDFVSEYGYWDTADKLDCVTNKEWERRKMDWEYAILSEDVPVPAMHGFTISLGDPRCPSYFFNPYEDMEVK